MTNSALSSLALDKIIFSFVEMNLFLSDIIMFLNRLMVHTYEKITTPAESEFCGKNCYTPCGEIEYFGALAETVYLRFFYFEVM